MLGINMVYERDLDLNLLRVFAVVAETGSVTDAAARLYLTQPAVSAALRRLSQAAGSALFVRSGRGIALTARGERLRRVVHDHLSALTDAVRASETFDPKTARRSVRIGLADAATAWLLPQLVALAEKEAPGLTLIALPVQFRTVGHALASAQVDLAVTVADDLPPDIVRTRLFRGDFVCLYDPNTLKLPRVLTRERYLREWHVVVSYNGDTRGLIEDYFGVRRKVRVSVASFEAVGALIDGSALIATLPRGVAHDIRKLRPHLRTTKPPFDIEGAYVELLQRRASQDDDTLSWLRSRIEQLSDAYARAIGLAEG